MDDLDLDHLLGNYYDLDEMQLLHEGLYSVALPHDAHDRLKKNVIAGIKAYRGGFCSIDYVLKKYGSEWKFPELSKDNKDLIKNIRIIKNEINNIADQIASGLIRPEHIGLFAAEASMMRLSLSFMSAILLISQGYTYEPLAICRLILEQISWSYAVHNINDEKYLMNLKPSKAITSLKHLLPSVGKLYRGLSQKAHLSPEIHHEYIAEKDGFMVVKYNIPEIINDAIIKLFFIADAYRIVAEYISWKYMHQLHAWELNPKGNLILKQKRPLSEYINLFAEK